VGSSAICEAVSPCEKLLDACAAPGGKSVLLSKKCKEVTSFQVHEHRVELIKSYASRMGVNNITALQKDSSVFDPNYEEQFDAVLCDAPCSGLGVIAKKPDIRYKNIADVNKLPEIQYGVLCGASKYVKDGGVLVYSTCTINKAENEDVVKKFLAENTDFKLEEDPYLPCGMRTFLPHRDGCDGFFAAKMRKTK
jgi:16S rRNA (cytosine967-C5)-methyltransferase